MRAVVIRAQKVPRRFHGHGDRILVPIRHGPLALAFPGKVGGNPGIGRGDCFALQTQARNIAAQRGKPDFSAHDRSSLLLLAFSGRFSGSLAVFTGGRQYRRRTGFPGIPPMRQSKRRRCVK